MVIISFEQSFNKGQILESVTLNRNFGGGLLWNIDKTEMLFYDICNKFDNTGVLCINIVQPKKVPAGSASWSSVCLN